MKITAATCRAARALLNISQAELARLSGVSARTIASFEGEEARTIAANLAMIKAALEGAGVEFLDGDGVRIRQAAEESR